MSNTYPLPLTTPVIITAPKYQLMHEDDYNGGIAKQIS